MHAELGIPADIGSWMALVERVAWNFPGLETTEALAEHRDTVLRFMDEGRALCVKENGAVLGVLLFSTKHNMICCLAVAPEHRRKGVASALLAEALARLDRSRDITVTTFREDDERGPAPRALYRRFGFLPGHLDMEFGSPVQEFVLPATEKAINIILYEEKYRDDMIFMVLEAKNALGRVPRLNEDLLNIRSNYLDKGDGFWLALDDRGRVVGCIGYSSIENSTEVCLHRLYVKCSRKRQGIGTMLLRTAEISIRSRGKTAIFVHLGGKEYFESHSFYPKHGYVTCGPTMMKKELT